jgi:hypothetical protein
MTLTYFLNKIIVDYRGRINQILPYYISNNTKLTLIYTGRGGGGCGRGIPLHYKLEIVRVRKG